MHSYKCHVFLHLGPVTVFINDRPVHIQTDLHVISKGTEFMKKNI